MVLLCVLDDKASSPGRRPTISIFYFLSVFSSQQKVFGFILHKVENTAFSGLSSLYILQLESSLICSFLHNLYLATFPQSLIYWPVVTSELLSPIRLFEQLEQTSPQRHLLRSSQPVPKALLNNSLAFFCYTHWYLFLS